MQLKPNTLFSTAESFQLCYTGHIVIVVVIVIISMVNFLSN